MIRARTGRAVPRPSALFPAVLAILVLASCTTSTSPGTATGSPSPSAGAASPSVGPLDSPSIGPVITEAPTDTPGASPSPPPSADTPACSGSDKNRAFFAKAALSLAWPVYCAVLPAGWSLEIGTYRMANGGELEVSYNGPGDAHIAMVEGNACAGFGSDINACAPRDTLIGAAAFGNATGELGQLSSAFVLDVDRGANPSWRVTGLGLSEADFRAICAAMLLVGSAN